MAPWFTVPSEYAISPICVWFPGRELADLEALRSLSNRASGFSRLRHKSRRSVARVQLAEFFNSSSWASPSLALHNFNVNHCDASLHSRWWILCGWMSTKSWKGIRNCLNLMIVQVWQLELLWLKFIGIFRYHSLRDHYPFYRYYLLSHFSKASSKSQYV